jgi:hypothetical protein
VAGGALPAVVVDRAGDAERCERLFIESDRTINITDGYEDVVEHGALSSI